MQLNQNGHKVIQKVDPEKIPVDSLFCDVCQKKTTDLVILTQEPVFEICEDCCAEAYLLFEDSDD